MLRISQNKPDQNGPAPCLRWRRIASEARTGQKKNSGGVTPGVLAASYGTNWKR